MKAKRLLALVTLLPVKTSIPAYILCPQNRKVIKTRTALMTSRLRIYASFIMMVRGSLILRQGVFQNLPDFCCQPFWFQHLYRVAQAQDLLG